VGRRGRKRQLDLESEYWKLLQAIGTLVDRRTGYLRLVHLPDGHSAEQLRVAMLPALTGLPHWPGRP
jgi:hypothetical protein